MLMVEVEAEAECQWCVQHRLETNLETRSTLEGIGSE
jgi:hypothetical protein